MATVVEGVQQTPSQRAITTRYLDFWLLGGASIVIWLLLVILTPLGEKYTSVRSYLDSINGFFVTCFLLVNYPHFMASYKLAYGKSISFLIKNWFQLIFVPLALIIFILHAFYFANFEPFWTYVINGMLHTVGIETSLQPLNNNYAKECMSILYVLLYISVGWHYSKQVFGCMMVYSHYDRYPLTTLQRQLLKWGSISIWLVNYFSYSSAPSEPHEEHGIKQFPLNFGIYPSYVSWVVLGLLFAGFLYFIVYKNYRKHKKLPSACFVVPYLSFAIWWLPVFYQPFFYMIAVPFFHSLQYLPFVFRVESRKVPAYYGALFRNLRNVSIIVILIITGWLGFDFIPEKLDAELNSFNTMGTFYFAASISIFINIHHYFIDNVIWRFDNSDVRNHLLN